MGRRINIVSFFLFFFFYISLFIVFIFLNVKHVVHLQSALFGQALLWHRCCKKEIKLQNNSLSLSFVQVRERVFFGGNPDRIPKSLR